MAEVEALTDRIVSALAAIDQMRGHNGVPVETKELLVDLRLLIIDIDHARRHYRRAVKLAATEFARLAPNKDPINVD
jgi:hypothetical protein